MIKLACVAPGACVFAVQVKGEDDVDSLKQAIRDKRGHEVQVFPLFFENNSDDLRRLVRGDASTRVRELMAQGEIDTLATVDDVFGDAPQKGVVHVLAAAPGWSSTRKLVCVVPGAEIFSVEVKGADDIDSLKRAIRDKRGHEVQVFPLLLDEDCDDVRRFVQGDAALRVRELMARGSIGPSKTIDDVFGDAPQKGVVHVLAAAPGWSSTRKLVCVVPGAEIFSVEVKGADDIDSLKQAIRDKRGHEVQVFPLFFENNSDDLRRLVRGDASTRVRELMAQGEIDTLATVDDVFGDAPQKGVVHVLAAAPGWSSTRKLVCVVPGAEIFSVEVKGADDIDSLKRAIRDKHPQLFQDEEIHVFPLLLESNSEDVRLLKRGDVSANVRSFMAKTKVDAVVRVDAVFGDAPREGVVHVLAVNPARPPRLALAGVLGKRARPHWDTLNARLQSLKRGKSKTAALSRIAWNTIESNYLVQDYTQEAKPVSPELVESARREVERSIKSIRSPKTEMECTCVLFSLFRELFANCRPQVKMNLQHRLHSQNNVLEAAGFADFVFYRRSVQVCVMEAKKVKDENEDEDEDGDVDEDNNDELREWDEMADGFAQALVGMELQNTYKSNPKHLVRGIVSNYTSWTFIRLEYPEDGSLPVVSRDEDRLVYSIRDEPTDGDLARILGKIMGTVVTEESNR